MMMIISLHTLHIFVHVSLAVQNEHELLTSSISALTEAKMDRNNVFRLTAGFALRFTLYTQELALCCHNNTETI